MQEYQLPLIPGEPLDDLQRALDAARTRWQESLLRHAVGSTQERDAWEGYRRASDAVWARIRQGRE